MMACIFGKSGRYATSSGSKFGHKKDIKWDLVGKCVERNEKKFRTQARARLISEQATRTFQIGDCVMLKFKQGEDGDKDKEDDEDSSEDENDSNVCLAQILRFYEILKQDGTAEGENADTYFIEIKWLYRPQDVTSKELRDAGLKSPLKDEHYFSDHVDSAPIESIIGKAHLRQTRKGIEACYNDPPKDFWEGTDKSYLCRYFYASSDADDHPKRMRKLESRELAFLLQNPTRKDLFEQGQLFRRNGPALKVDENNQPLMYKHIPITEDPAERIKKKKKTAQHRKVFKCSCCIVTKSETLPAASDTAANPDADMQVDARQTSHGRKRVCADAESTDNVAPAPDLQVSGAVAVDLQLGAQGTSEIEPASASISPPASASVQAPAPASTSAPHPKRRRVAVMEDQGFAPNASATIRALPEPELKPEPNGQFANDLVKDEDELEEMPDIPPPDEVVNQENPAALSLANTLSHYGLNQR